jgi:hypothetical protein
MEDLHEKLKEFAKELGGKLRSAGGSYSFGKKIKVRVQKVHDDFRIVIEIPNKKVEINGVEQYKPVWVYRNKGVGRGRAAGSGKNNPDQFINRILEEEIPRLNKIVINHFQDTFINTAKTFLK